MFNLRISLVGGAAILLAATVQAENWPQWRGPAFNGSTPEKNLPAQWSKSNNVAWSAALPGPSAATPVIWGDHVFVSSTDLQNQSLVAMAFNRKTGALLWSHKVSDGFRRDDRSNYASPSPATDGQRVVFFYGNGAMAAFDFTGRKLWERNIQKDYGTFAFLWTFSSSPLLFQNRLYLQVLQRDVPVDGRGRTDGPNESYLLALNPATGQTLWRQVRHSDAVAESREAFSTPIPNLSSPQQEILIVGGDCITGHDAATGRELWRWGTWNPTRIGHWRLVPSPVAGKGVALACAPKASPVFAVKTGGSGILPESFVAWKSDPSSGVTSDVPTPLFYMDDFFILSDLKKTLARVEPATGKIKWSIKTPGNAKYEASPTGADGRIFLMNFKGDVVIVDAQRGEVLQNIQMGDPGDDQIRSTIAVSQGQLFIRTNRRLYCVGQ